MIPTFSVVIPVYNRPQEVEELLSSLATIRRKDFEVIIVEDGSTVTCEKICEYFRDRLDIRYFFKPNSGPGPSRNYGFEKAAGKYFVIFDSDCIIPAHYFDVVETSLQEYGWDAWGGPDRAHENFTIAQRAMGYTMSSVLTTGGIRGGEKHVGWFQPRSFNMGVSRIVFEKTGGFMFDRYAEDIEFSIRMKQAGFKVGLIQDAYVFHKRRTTLSQFYKQVFNFGRGRALIGRKFPSEVKLTHWFPTVFAFALIALIPAYLVFPLLGIMGALFFTGYLFLIFLHALLLNKNLAVASLSVPAALIQFFGYGFGFFKERLKSYLSK